MNKIAIIKRKGDKWELRTRDGKRVLGTHDSKQDAYKQEYAIQKSQEKQGQWVAPTESGYHEHTWDAAPAGTPPEYQDAKKYKYFGGTMNAFGKSRTDYRVVDVSTGEIVHAGRLGNATNTGEVKHTNTGVNKQGQAATAQYTPEVLYRALAAPETGNEKNQWIRTKYAPKGGSTAYGPVQVTGTLTKDYATRYPKLFDEAETNWLKRYNAQADLFNRHGKMKGKLPDYDAKYDYGGTGHMGDTDEDKAMYKQVMQKIIGHGYEQDKYDMDKFITRWRGKTPGAGYRDKVLAALPPAVKQTTPPPAPAQAAPAPQKLTPFQQQQRDAAVARNQQEIASIQARRKALEKQNSAKDIVQLQFQDETGNVKAAIDAEIADTPELRRKGLSKRSSIQAGTGMFFDKVGAYWMKDVNFDLDILFLDKAGSVLEKQHMPRENTDFGCRYLYAPTHKQAAHALELPAGWFDEQGLEIGDTVCPVVEKQAQVVLREREPNKAINIAAGAGAASLPGTSLGQYLLRDYPEVMRKVMAAKEVAPTKAGLKSFYRPTQLGDIILEGGTRGHPLGFGSELAFGVPTGHGTVRGLGKGQKGAIFHGGANVSQLGELGEAEEFIKALEKELGKARRGKGGTRGIPKFRKSDLRKMWKEMSGLSAGQLTQKEIRRIGRKYKIPRQVTQRITDDFLYPGRMGTTRIHRQQSNIAETLKSRWEDGVTTLSKPKKYTGKNIAKRLDNWFDRFRYDIMPKPIKRTGGGALTQVRITPADAYTGPQKKIIAKRLARATKRPYGGVKALWQGARNVMFPTFLEDLIRVCDPKSDICTTLPAQIVEATGKGKQRFGKGTIQFFTNPKLKIQSIYNKPRFIQMMRMAKRGRIGLGLAAMGLMGAGAAGLANKIQKRIIQQRRFGR